MIRKITAVLIFFAIQLVACGAPAPSGEQSAPEQTTLPAETLVPTDTPAPTDTPTPAATATFSGPWLTPLKNEVDCRFGPTPLYEQIGTLDNGAAAEIIGVSEDGGWFQTANPEEAGTICWFNGDLVTTTGDVSQLPVIPAPVGEVTRIEILINKYFIVYSGNGGYVETPMSCDQTTSLNIFSSIWTNGPITATYHWEIHGDAEIIDDDLTVSTDRAREISDEVIVDEWVESFMWEDAHCGDYSVVFVVTSPNVINLEREFTIPLDCPADPNALFCELGIPE